MPNIYLSPSLQPYNLYLTQGNEQYYMNLIADAMEPYLYASGIQFTRNTPDTTLRQAISESNDGNYDLHLALHSNAAPENLSGTLQGPHIYYSQDSAIGEEVANIIANNLKFIYPYPEKIKVLTTTSLAEVRQTKAPAVLVEVAYHDNPEDEYWIINNIPEIGKNLVESLTYYFDIPFATPLNNVSTGFIATDGGNVNLRAKPAFSADIITQIPNGSAVTLQGKWDNWYIVSYDNNIGYVYGDFINII